MCGITIEQFWDYTFNDINAVLKANNELRKEELRRDYELAKQISYFVNMSLVGEHIPALEEIYPELFKKKNTEDDDKVATKLYLEQFKDYALQHNKKRARSGGD